MRRFFVTLRLNPKTQTFANIATSLCSLRLKIHHNLVIASPVRAKLCCPNEEESHLIKHGLQIHAIGLFFFAADSLILFFYY